MNLRHDIFNFERLKGATFAGLYEYPKVAGRKIDSIPDRIVGFDKLNGANCPGSLIHFFVDDSRYGRIYRKDCRCLSMLLRAELVIGLDHSVYRDLPFSEQIHSIYLNRATDYWLQRNGVNVVPNVSCGDERVYGICCDGIEPASTIAMSSYGHKRRGVDKRYFTEGFRHISDRLRPYSVLFHGPCSAEIESIAAYYGIRLIPVPSRIECVFGGRAA